MLTYHLRWFYRLAIFLYALYATTAYASPIQITVDTSSLAGTSATMAFDLIDGGSPSNSVTISSFSTDGTLGTSSSTGSVSGSFPANVTLDDSSFFNEYLQQIQLGNTLQFVINDTGHTADPSSLPDGFSFFLLDSTSSFSLATTSDPTGADALFLLNIGQAPSALEIYASDTVSTTTEPIPVVPPPNNVPEPGSLWLVLLGIAFLIIALVWKQRNALVAHSGAL